jgi:8-oxo-dGTP diphosphatase
MTSSHTTGTAQPEGPVPKLFCHFCGQRLIRKHWEGRVRPFCEHCRTPVYENPVPATAVVVFDETKGLLLVKRKAPPKQGYWALAGGFMELSESVENAALRELHEETGLSGKVDRLLGVVANDSLLYGTVLIVGYLVIDYTGDLLAGDDAEKVDFFPVGDIPEIAFSSHREFIEIALDHLGRKLDLIIRG